MKKNAFICLLLFLSIITTACQGDSGNREGVPQAGMRVVTDMAGRRVEIPAQVKQVYSTGQPGVVALYTIDPELLLGWCIKLSPEEAEYIAPQYLGLPVLGLMQGSGDTANREEIMRRSPDLILMMTYLDQNTIADADALQKRMGIPVVLADIVLNKIPEAYRFLGDILSRPERAELLANYSEDVLAEAVKQAALIPEAERLSVYYAQGSDGLQTAPRGSSHSEVIDIVGGENIVTLPAKTDGRLTVNMEQVLLWNPEVIIASYSVGHAGVKSDGSFFDILSGGEEAWNSVAAVQNDRVFCAPCYPYNWLDMPPGANRLIGIPWMGNLLYPDYFALDMREEIREFYRLFYHQALTAGQIDALLTGAVKKN
ncbi:ABC transporter substrate-binding protein [Desulfoscipio sp. XC116]|uniref:ABC transporter substrate-binding protein n=1 Tax=Desulfoscipio sp. XC116 TaxID=3144975 RepID=UPI00325A9274